MSKKPSTKILVLVRTRSGFKKTVVVKDRVSALKEMAKQKLLGREVTFKNARY